MKQIGKGYWYTVYDLGNGRVLKREKSIFEKITDTYDLEGGKILNWIVAVYRLLTSKSKIIEDYEYIQEHADLSILGNPVFEEGLTLEQDKAVLLGENLSRALIDLYIQNCIACWRNGFADRVYNFTINNGVDKDGRVILLDFNEITRSKEKVLAQVLSKRWLKAWSYAHLEPEFQKYYAEQMDLHITRESLEANWKK